MRPYIQCWPSCLAFGKKCQTVHKDESAPSLPPSFLLQLSDFEHAMHPLYINAYQCRFYPTQVLRDQFTQ